jgi:SHS2 domain-containing protein
MKPYELIDISGDVGLKAFGKTLEEVFINSAAGMFSLITEFNLIEGKKSLDITVESHSLEGLLVSWLNELIFQFDTYGFICKTITISELITSQYKLKASVSGEDFIPEKHESKLLIKAATYHKLKIEKSNDIWEAHVIFDI